MEKELKKLQNQKIHRFTKGHLTLISINTISCWPFFFFAALVLVAACSSLTKAESWAPCIGSMES